MIQKKGLNFRFGHSGISHPKYTLHRDAFSPSSAAFSRILTIKNWGQGDFSYLKARNDEFITFFCRYTAQHWRFSSTSLTLLYLQGRYSWCFWSSENPHNFGWEATNYSVGLGPALTYAGLPYPVALQTCFSTQQRTKCQNLCYTEIQGIRVCLCPPFHLTKARVLCPFLNIDNF